MIVAVIGLTEQRYNKIFNLKRLEIFLAACVRFWQVLAGYDRLNPHFVRERFGNPSVVLRKKHLFSEETPNRYRTTPEETVGLHD
ncbi:hypothetical protein ASE55_19285 [Chryseobacterium sp. Leaf201]|nr:hypothetical protein ASE55_19285 [Chryseobacterium sp. Leaf201]